MPTYRIMDSDGTVIDKDQKPLDLGHEEVLKWYKDMLTGADYHVHIYSRKAE